MLTSMNWTPPLRSKYSSREAVTKPDGPKPDQSEIQPQTTSRPGNYNMDAQSNPLNSQRSSRRGYESRASRAERSKAYANQSATTGLAVDDLLPPPIAAQRERSRSRSRSPTRRPSVSRKKRLRRARNSRIVAYTFLGCAAAAFVGLFVWALAEDNWQFEDMNLNPWFGPSSQALQAVGAQSLDDIDGTQQQWWRLLTSPFVNAGIIHIAVNLIGLCSYGYYAVNVLPLAALTVPLVYIFGSVFATIASANLDAYYVVCAASGGVCALIGVAWADNIVNPRPLIHQKLSAFFILILVTGSFIAIHLLPLVDIWIAIGATIAGFLASFIILVLPKVGKGADNNTVWVSCQIVAVLLLFGATTVGIVGLAMSPKVGQEASFLKDASCLNVDWWFCVQQTNSTGGCTYSPLTEGASQLVCPNGVKFQLTGVDAIHPDDPSIVSMLCEEYCGVDPASGTATPLPSSTTSPALAPSGSNSTGGGASGGGVGVIATAPTGAGGNLPGGTVPVIPIKMPGGGGTTTGGGNSLPLTTTKAAFKVDDDGGRRRRRRAFSRRLMMMGL